MAEKQLTLPGQIVKKHNELVRSKLHIDSVQASKIIASLIACIRTDDTDLKDFYSIQVSTFLDESGRAYKNIKTTCKNLIFAHVELEEPDVQNPKGHPTLSLITFFREIEYHRGVVRAQFNSNLRELLLNLQRCFTEYSLIEYLKLPSLYSQRIFEILKSWSGLPEVVIRLDELHHMLNVPASFKKDFREFRRWVLEKAHKDINEKTDFSFEWEPVKVGRSVESIRFIFAPGRKVITRAKRQRAESGQVNAAANKKFLTARDCAKRKKGACIKQDNKKAVCAECVASGFCDEIRQQTS